MVNGEGGWGEVLLGEVRLLIRAMLQHIAGERNKQLAGEIDDL